MVLNTFTVSAAVAPEVVGTTVSHYIHRKQRRHKPTAHISYDLGLHLVRKFVNYSSLHTVEELQAFTGQRVPVPTWVHTVNVDIPQSKLSSAATYLQKQLGPAGVELVGGKEWWQWRCDNGPLKAEWIEMRHDYNQRKATGDKGSRIMLYVHGGAYYFGSVDEHRYQMQRHARKLKARCLAPRYRLAPQFPFPCGLYDCLAAYLYLLDEYEPSSILLAGDSAGGGMVTSLLVVLRDQNIPLPAGAILLSPWVDLMHSFPSLAGDGKFDYIPNNGFIHKPSISWPPPTLEADEKMPSGVAAATNDKKNGSEGDDLAPQETEASDRGFSSVPADTTEARPGPTAHSVPSIEIDGRVIQIRDQIQIYAPNHLLTHPLVSPVLQPSLGGLPPLLIQVGGGEMLRDEQIYLAHKAANPERYAASDEILDRYDPDRVQLKKYKPTDVQLQVWEDICHVGHTLSWTHPAKYMYRSVAQFGAWALARAQKRSIDIMDEEDESDAESTTSAEEQNSSTQRRRRKTHNPGTEEPSTLPDFVSVQASKSIGKAGDPLPPFKDHMIRQRVNRHGLIYDLAPPDKLIALQMKPSEIGVLKEIPVRKWLKREEEWNRKFASRKKRLQKERAQQLAKGYIGIPPGEKPPPTALAGRRTQDMPKREKVGKSWGIGLWSSWGSKYDGATLERKETDDAHGSKGLGGALERPTSTSKHLDPRSPSTRTSKSRPRSTSRTVQDEGQVATSDADGPSDTIEPQRRYGDSLAPHDAPSPGTRSTESTEQTVIPHTHTTSTRPTHGGIAYPFKMLAPDDLRDSTNASMVTLHSDAQEENEDGGKHGEEANGKEADEVNVSAANGVAAERVNEASSAAETPTAERFVTAPEFNV